MACAIKITVTYWTRFILRFPAFFWALWICVFPSVCDVSFHAIIPISKTMRQKSTLFHKNLLKTKFIYYSLVQTFETSHLCLIFLYLNCFITSDSELLSHKSLFPDILCDVILSCRIMRIIYFYLHIRVLCHRCVTTSHCNVINPSQSLKTMSFSGSIGEYSGPFEVWESVPLRY